MTDIDINEVIAALRARIGALIVELEIANLINAKLAAELEKANADESA